MGRKASTGPRTVEGKERASRNALQHGCTSKRLLLPGEDAGEWEKLQAQWLADYEPDKPTFREQVLRAAEGEWLLRRAVGRYNDAELQLYTEQPDALAWTEEQHKLMERFGRYRTTAQRWFHRERGAAEQLRKARFSEGLRVEAARRREAEAAGEEDQTEEELPVVAEPVTPKPLPIVQSIEVNLDEQGRTVTRWYPPHDRIKFSAQQEPGAVIVKRNYYFFCAVPPEYYWLTDDPAERGPKAEFWRTVPYAQWLEYVEMEERNGDGLLVG